MTQEASRRSRKAASISRKATVRKPPILRGPRMSHPVDAEEIYFYRTTGKYGFLSQWFNVKFSSEDGTVYSSAEQYMMFQKAKLFGDEVNAKAILESSNQKDIKRLGRQVTNFNEATWEENRVAIVTQGNYLKFTASDKMMDGKKLSEKLLETGDKMLIEASAGDRIWGIGYSAGMAPNYREAWGLNLLGNVLVSVRERIRGEMTA